MLLIVKYNTQNRRKAIDSRFYLNGKIHRISFIQVKIRTTGKCSHELVSPNKGKVVTLESLGNPSIFSMCIFFWRHPINLDYKTVEALAAIWSFTKISFNLGTTPKPCIIWLMVNLPCQNSPHLREISYSFRKSPSSVNTRRFLANWLLPILHNFRSTCKQWKFILSSDSVLFSSPFCEALFIAEKRSTDINLIFFAKLVQQAQHRVFDHRFWILQM